MQTSETFNRRPQLKTHACFCPQLEIALLKNMVSSAHNWLHRIGATTQGKNEMERGSTLELVFLGSLVIRPGGEILVSLGFEVYGNGGVGNQRDVHLLAAVDEALLNRGNAFLLLDLLLYPGDLSRVHISRCLPQTVQLGL